MPSLEKHIQLSLQRTGKEYREVHEWLDGKSLGWRERTKRHTRPERFLPLVEKNFGKDGSKEYLQHLRDDEGLLLKILRLVSRA